MKITLSILLITCVLFSQSCQESNEPTPATTINEIGVPQNVLYNEEIKNFGHLVAIAATREDVRVLLKNEALKKIDGDYDISCHKE